MWRVDQHQATFTRAELACQVAFDRPDLGASHLAVAGRVYPDARILAVLPGPQPLHEHITDHYVREHDLIVTYAQTPPRTVRPQLYWRFVTVAVAEDAAVAGVELVVSVETDRLESQPQTQVRSRLPAASTSPAAVPNTVMVYTSGPEGTLRSHRLTAGQALKLTPPLDLPLVVVPLDERWHYLELAYPGDFSQAQIAATASEGGAGRQVEITWSLFDEHLEKGVIRRARLRGLFVPAAASPVSYGALLAQFANSELPLTT